MTDDPDHPEGAAWDAIRLTPADSVATALRPIAVGETPRVVDEAGATVSAPQLTGAIPRGHKFALHQVAAGDDVVKYGAPIGTATAAIDPGAHVHLHNLDGFAGRAARGGIGPMSAGSFMGYGRATTAPGVRNHVLIVSLSGLEHGAARALHRLFPQTVLIASTYGRGHVGEDRAFQRHMMAALATHPNAGACLVLGPDEGMTAHVAEALEEAGRPHAALSLQGIHEDRFRLIDEGGRALTRLIREASAARRTEQPVSALSLAVECGHSDATSGLVANRLCGRLMEQHVAGGGRAVFSETLEWTGTDAILAARAATPAVADAIRDAIARRHAQAAAAGHDVQAGNPGPQNHDGGITTLEEKSLGAIAKGGDQPIAGLVREGAPLGNAPGLYLMDTPCFSPESITSMVAGGAQLALFTTGAGNPYVSALAPTLKISANPDSVRRLAGQIDFDASAVVEGRAPLDALVPALAALVADTASGTLTYGEAAGEGAESISRLGASI